MIADPVIPAHGSRTGTDFRGFDWAGLIYDRVRMAMGNGLATAGQHDHRRQRLIMQPAFRHEHLRGYVAVIRQEITAVMGKWQDGHRVDMVDEMFRLTTGVALRALFSSQLASGEAALHRAESLGGKRQLGPVRAPTGLVVGHFTDPEGHLVGVAGTM